MTKNRNPARHVTGGGAGNVDQAGKQVERPYRSETSTRKAPSLFDQLERLAHHTKIAAQFEHAYGHRAKVGGARLMKVSTTMFGTSDGGGGHDDSPKRRRPISRLP
jgi:hypothetical protein